jgi:hypothetical protein
MAATTPMTCIPMSEDVLRDKVYGAWPGQLIGVTCGFPTEFYPRYIWELCPHIPQIDGEPTKSSPTLPMRPATPATR